MVYKNIAKERELEGDVLRQRRDLYATSLGLILFHLAGARLRDDAVLTAVPVHLARPDVLYWAAWAAMFYFLFRYWMVAPAIVARFQEEWRIQTLASKKYRQLVIEYASHCTQDSSKISHYVSSGVIPNYASQHPYIQWNDLRNLRNWPLSSAVGPIQATTVQLSEHELESLRAAVRRGFVRAVFFERTASDVIAPYLVAAIAIAVALF
jgi:hypothetical protein